MQPPLPRCVVLAVLFCLLPVAAGDSIRSGGGDSRFLNRGRSRALNNNNNNNTWEVQPAIIDGQKASPTAYPFFVRSFGGIGLCGGTLIHPDVVVTAAHCEFVFYDGMFVSYYEGASNGLYRQVLYQMRNMKYDDNRNNIDGDILMLILDQPVVSVDAAPINSSPQIPSTLGETLITIGIGETTDTGNISNILLQTDMTYLSNQQCSTYFTINDDNICAGSPQGTVENICSGDSGGPLLNQDGVLVGITSFSTDPCDNGLPAAFTRVSYYYQWIYDNICQYSSVPFSNCSSAATYISPVTNSSSDPNRAHVRIYIQYDDHPEDNTYAVRDMTTRAIIYSGPIRPPVPDQLTATDLYLFPGPYRFEIYDQYGDGMITGRVGGYYIAQVDPDGQTETSLTSQISGNFGASKTTRFTVTASNNTDSNSSNPSTPGPTPVPTAVTSPPVLAPTPFQQQPLQPPIGSPSMRPTRSAPTKKPSYFISPTTSTTNSNTSTTSSSSSSWRVHFSYWSPFGQDTLVLITVMVLWSII